MTKTFIKASRSSKVQIPEMLLIGRKEVNFRHWSRYANSGRNHSGFEAVERSSLCCTSHPFFNQGNREHSMSETGPVSFFSILFLVFIPFQSQTRSLRRIYSLMLVIKWFLKKKRLKSEKGKKQQRKQKKWR